MKILKENSRRDFIKQTIVLSAASLLELPAIAGASASDTTKAPYVNFTRDGLDFSPADYVQKLNEIAVGKGIEPDSYSNNGVVKELEEKMAAVLGKEAAVYMPTGTMANHIAVRKLAKDKTRVLVQAESHLYNDSGDTAQVLSNLNLVPLNPGKTTFTLNDVKIQLARVKAGRVHTGIGAISIESPVRRTHNEIFDFGEMKKISEYAKANGIGMHLDGARLFNAPAHTGVSVQEYAALFDTVYISLYKDFNAASGAVLVGSKSFCKDLFHTRRMFGGSQPNAWPFAAVALQYIDSFQADYEKALQHTRDVFKALPNQFKLEEIEHGSNVMKLHVLQGSPHKINGRLAAKNIKLNVPAAKFSGFYVKVNPSVLRLSKNVLIANFAAAAG